MRIQLVTGGARGGKSRYAAERATLIGGDGVTFVATARASDEEMARRIARHRAERSDRWVTVEAPVEAHRAVHAAETAVVLIDCLTLLTANALGTAYEQGEEAALRAMRREAEQLMGAAAEKAGTLIVVTNEVGFGIHPETTVGRWFRDGLGTANQLVADAADEVVLMVSGIPVTVKPSRAPVR